MRIDIVKIRKVDTEKRVFEGESLSTGSVYVNIRIVGPVNDTSLPSEFDETGMEGLGSGQLALVLFDDNERPFCIGFLEVNFKQKLEKFLERKVQPGEKIIKGIRDQELYFDRHGSFRLTSVEDGINYSKENKEISLRSNILKFLIGGVEVVIGFVKRVLMGIIEGTEIAQEFSIKVFKKLLNLKITEVSIGNLYDDVGVPIMGLRERARFLLRVFNEIGIPVSEIIIDALGNLTLKMKTADMFIESLNTTLQGVKVDLKVLEFNIGTTGVLEKVILGETFYNLFKNHVHSTPLGPTSPPTVILPDMMVLSKTTKTD